MWKLKNCTKLVIAQNWLTKTHFAQLLKHAQLGIMSYASHNFQPSDFPYKHREKKASKGSFWYPTVSRPPTHFLMGRNGGSCDALGINW